MDNKLKLLIGVLVTGLVVALGVSLPSPTVNAPQGETLGGLIHNVTETFTSGLKVTPVRTNSAYDYGVDINSGNAFFKGGAATKSYQLTVRGDRLAGNAATGDSNDALIRASYSNYAANDTNFIMRGVNASLANRSGGTLGVMEAGNFGSQGKSGGTSGTIRGLTVTPENYGTVSDEFSGIDVNMKNEGTVATLEYGLRVRNTNNSIADAVGAGLLFSDTGANTGFDYLIDATGASVTTGDIRFSVGAKLITGNNPSGVSCNTGDLYLDADTAKLHMCTSANTWSSGSQL